MAFDIFGSTLYVLSKTDQRTLRGSARKWASRVLERLSVTFAILLSGALMDFECGFGLILKASASGTFHGLGVFLAVWRYRQRKPPGFAMNTVTIE